MPVLTDNEATVLDIVRQQGRYGDPVAASTIKDHALNGHGIRYDSVDRALRGLISLGKVKRPSRGYYMPTMDRS